jgi:hypothetical protein
LPSPPPQAAKASASSRPGTSPTLMRVIAVLLLSGRSGLLVLPCQVLLAGLDMRGAPLRRCGAGVATGRLPGGNGRCHRPVTASRHASTAGAEFPGRSETVDAEEPSRGGV